MLCRRLDGRKPPPGSVSAKRTYRRQFLNLARLLVVPVLVMGGCFRGEEPLPPHEALAKAGHRIDAILGDERAMGRQEAAPRAPAETPKNPGEIAFWHYAHPIFSGMAARPRLLMAFAESHPGVKLTPQYIGDWSVAIQKLTVSLAAGDLPDIALVKRSWLARLIPSGLIVPLETLLPPALIEDLRAASRNEFTINGHLYALPADGFCSILYYNRELVAAPPKTWEELRRVARDACRPNDAPRKTVYGIGDLPFLETLWSAGGDVCDEHAGSLDTVQAREALDFILSLRDDKLAHPRGLGTPEGAFELFLDGRVAMTVASSQNLPRTRNAKFPIGIAPAPGKTGPISMLSDDALVVFAKYAEAKRPAIAAVLDFLTGPDFQGKEAAALGSVPPRAGLAKDVSPPPGLEDAYLHARNTPLVGAWASIEFELTRYLSLAYQWQPRAR